MQITDRDWAQLSAYLDGELSGRELRKLRKKIQTDPLLQVALEQLKITRQILQAAPQIPAPRNFILTPEMIGMRSKKPSFSGYRLAAALMSFLLIGVLILDFGGILFSGAMSAVSSQKSFESQLESMPEAAADAMEEPVILDAAEEISEDQAIAEYEEEFADVEAPAVAADSAEAVEAVEESLAEGIVVEEQEEKTQDADADADAATGANRAQGGDDPQSTGQVLPSQTPEPPPVVVEYYPEEEVYGPEREAGISTLRILEILFGLGVVGFSTAAWIKRRKFR